LQVHPTRETFTRANLIHQAVHTSFAAPAGTALAPDPKIKPGIGVRLGAGVSAGWVWEEHGIEHLAESLEISCCLVFAG
jgi:hypothetical protein